MFLFFLGGWGRGGGVSATSGIEPVDNKYLPFPLADRLFKSIVHIQFHLSLNVNDYRDSALVARH